MIWKKKEVNLIVEDKSGVFCSSCDVRSKSIKVGIFGSFVISNRNFSIFYLIVFSF